MQPLSCNALITLIGILAPLLLILKIRLWYTTKAVPIAACAAEDFICHMRRDIDQSLL